MDPKELERLLALVRKLPLTSKAQSAASGIRSLSLAKLRDYANGEQFKNGQYWRGRKPVDADGNISYVEIEKLFNQSNQIGPCLHRIVAGILGRDPDWATQSTEAQDEEEKEPSANKFTAIELALTAWHQEAEVHRLLKTALFNCLWAGRSFLRLYVPDEYREQAEQVKTLEGALELIHLQALDATKGHAVRDAHGRMVAYLYGYQEEQQNRYELHTPEYILKLDSNMNLLEAERYAFAENPNVYDNPLYDETRLRRPAYLMFMLEREQGDSAITIDAIDAQDSLNVSRTYMRRNDDTAGFRTLVTMNAEEPLNQEGKPTVWRMGPDLTINLIGIPDRVEDSQGGVSEETGIVTPSYGVIEPVDPETLITSSKDYKREILERFDQLHIEDNFKAVSGKSKQETREPYEKRLLLEAPPVAAALTWLLDSTYRFACTLIKQTPQTLMFNHKLFVDVSQGNLEAFTALAANYPETVSLETVIAANPLVDDVIEEKRRLKEQHEALEKARRDEAERLLGEVGGG